MRLTLCCLLAGLTACLPACSDEGSQPERPAAPTDSAQPAAPRAEIEASVKSLAEVRELIDSYDGKVVVLDLWALW